MAPTGLTAVQLAAVMLGSLGLATPVMAYVGPGAGLTAIGIPVALIGGLVLAIIGFVWYPLRRLRRNRKAAAQRPPNDLPDHRPGGRLILTGPAAPRRISAV